MPQTNTIQAQTVTEGIASVLHQIFHGSMNIVVARIKDEERIQIPSGDTYIVQVIDQDYPVQDFALSKNNYTALMSNKPGWSPDKPSGVYSESDLWLCVAAQRAGTDLAIGTVD